MKIHGIRPLEREIKKWPPLCKYSSQKFGSSSARYSNFVSIPPEIDIPDTPDLSIFDVILDEKSHMAVRP